MNSGLPRPRALVLDSFLVSFVSVVVALTSSSSQPLAHSGVSGDPVELISINDNRVPAGTLANGTLTVHLEARAGEWHPDGDADPGVVVRAFAADGGKLQVPSPLIRVVEGTTVHAIIHNALADKPLVVHGLYTRPANSSSPSDAVSVPAGETREVHFVAGAPGVYFYWAEMDPLAFPAPPDALSLAPRRAAIDTQLSGAFVIDPSGASLADRVLLITHWVRTGDKGQLVVGRIVINGKSWPHTEHLTYSVGDSVRLRVLNVGAAVHPMHLHGFYFNTVSRGDEQHQTTFDAASPHMVVTERIEPGRTASLVWVPTRPGNWLFHCHDTAHIQYTGALDAHSVPPPDPTHADHMMEMMAGPVMGITVTGTSVDPIDASVPRRQLRLVARVDSGGTETEPSYGYTLDSGDGKVPPPPYQPSPTIVLKRGEPVSITVVNQLPEPTSVHWHGIELESYYDGVPGFAGEATRLSPAIEPGGAFEARFTPPRSGTFIYHTHVNDLWQQKAGLAGPLLVVDSPDSYDPEHDVVLMITTPRRTADAAVVLLNGSSTPAAREFQAGKHYRLRFINLHISRPSMHMQLVRGFSMLTWRAIAKDGRDLPPDQATEQPSDIQMGNGETYDFDFVPDNLGDIRLDVVSAAGALLVTMPIHIRQ